LPRSTSSGQALSEAERGLGGFLFTTKDNNQTGQQDKGGFCQTTKDAECREKGMVKRSSVFL